MMREFGVRLVEDDELPEKEWMIATTPCKVMALVRRSCLSERTLAEAWVAFRQQQGEHGARAMGVVAALLPLL